MKLRGIKISPEIKSYLINQKVVVLSLVSFFITFLLLLSGVLNPFELKAYDLYSRYLNPANKSEEIVIIEIDQQSLDALSREGITWLWPRQVYAPIIEYLSQADAVFIDMLFSEPSSYGQEDDQIFAEAINKAKNVYLPVFLSRREEIITSEEEDFIKHIAIRDKISPAPAFNSVTTPIDILKNAVKGSGNITISPDEDGIYRGIPLVFQLKELIIPHFLLGYLIEKGIIKIVQNSLFVKDTKIPLVDGKLMLRYNREGSPFKVFSFTQILRSYLDSNASATPTIKKDFFKGKVVFIGLTAAGLYDLKPTSVSSISTGVLINATTLDNIVNRSFIRPVSEIFVIGFMLLICIFISYSVLRRYSLLINLSLFIVSLSTILLITAVLFKNALYMNIIPPVVSLMMSFMISVAYSYATEGRQRLFLKRTFSQYMDKRIADYLLENPSLIKPGGQNKRLTVFFADIAGFTSISEKISAEKIATMLHMVLNSLTEVIIQNNGVIDKYIGDCVMAFWGAPLETDKDEINACYAAIQCINSLGELNNLFRGEGFSEIAIRIGIHSGDAIAGNIGSDRLFHYTAIGDTVNLASRLESVNKFFKTRIIISEDTIKETNNHFFTRGLGVIEVKGKTLPIKIFELIGEKGNIAPDNMQLVTLFHRGMTFYEVRKWHEAVQIFDEILEKYPHDGPSEFYRNRCEYLISNSCLTENWNIIKFTEK
ncbi:MAG TPA: adenylate/guanylate cyclase domain-containing protein [Thermodesulfobacteriota bacterium]|nr:adenylate/guanylate cyclase domain-containing protein [Thermodesulfobacteriota bacterium]